MSAPRDRVRLVGALALFLALALGGQALADSLVPDASGEATGQAVGQAASSYLTGIRRYTAAALWNRLDPLLHGYYSGASLGDQRYMLSTIVVVQALDPNSVLSYDVGPWILVQNDRVEEGLAMARRGVENNPKSGLLRVDLAQLLELYGNDTEGAVEQGLVVLDGEMEWTDLSEEHNAYSILAAVFRQAGRPDLDARTQAELERLDTEAGDQIPADAHDHDGDGVADH
jgi:hypothetical protein